MDAKTTAELTANITTYVLAQFKAEQKALVHQKCHKYARFFAHIPANQSNAIYWSLFIFVIILLAVASLLWSSQDKHHNNFQKASLDEENSHDLTVLESKKQKSHQRVVLASILCFSLALPSVIVEAFAGMAITFCHKEDTPFLYWGVFFLLSVGSLIAIMGLSFGIIFSHRRPPWNLNLGTPVLVIAGLVHLAVDGCKDTIQKWRGKELKKNNPAPLLSRSMTTHSASSENSQIPAAWQLLQPDVEMPENCTLIGTFPDTGMRIISLAPITPLNEKRVPTVSITALTDTTEPITPVSPVSPEAAANANTSASTDPTTRTPRALPRSLRSARVSTMSDCTFATIPMRRGLPQMFEKNAGMPDPTPIGNPLPRIPPQTQGPTAVMPQSLWLANNAQTQARRDSALSS